MLSASSERFGSYQHRGKRKSGREVRASSVPHGARTTEGQLFVLSCSWLSHGLSAGQTRKEGRRGVPCREMINEAVPVREPLLPCPRDHRGPAVFHGVHCPHVLIPPQRM